MQSSSRLFHRETQPINSFPQPINPSPWDELENFEGYNSELAELVLGIFAKEDNRAVLLENFNNIEKKFLNPKNSYDVPESLLFKLIQQNDWKSQEAALALIDLGINSIDSKNGYDKRTPLHEAAEKGNVLAVKALIDKNANVNALYELPYGGHIGFNTVSPMASALENKNTAFEIFTLLVDAGADPNLGCSFQMPIFNSCISKDLLDCAELIIDRVDVNTKDPVVELTPLHFATSRGNIGWMKKLIARGANVNAFGLAEGLLVSPRKMSPLHVAAKKGNVDAVNLLLESGADPNLKAENNLYGSNLSSFFSSPEPLTPFQIAVDYDHQEVVDAFLNFAKQNNYKLDGCNFKRSILSENLDTIKRKGYSTLDLRVITANARMKGEIDGVRGFAKCYCLDEEYYPVIQKCFTDFICDPKNLKAAKTLCVPLINFFESYLKKNQKLGLYFLTPGSLSDNITGCYNAETSEEIAILVDSKTPKRIIPVIFHEIVHLASHQIYQNLYCAPNRDSEFFEALEIDLKHLKDTNYEGCPSILRLLFKNVKLYDEAHHPAEYLARIPQVALSLALEDPELTWNELEGRLKKSIPNLLDFFMNDFLKKCE